MAQHSLGLDIGEHSIKAILLAKGLFGSAKLLRAEEIAIDDGGIEEGLAKCRNLFPKQTEALSVSIDRRDVALRILELPTRDNKTIRKLAPFQMDGKLPFKGDAYFDGCPLSKGKEQQTPALLCAIEQSKMAQHLELVERAFGQKPTHHQVDSLAAASVYLHEQQSQGWEILADIGAKKTTLTLFVDGELKVSRLLLFALPARSAEKFAKDGEAEELAHRLAAEVKRLLLSSGGDLEALKRMVLVGGGALRPALATKLSEALSCPAEALQAEILGQKGAHFTTALGLALTPLVAMPLALDFFAHKKPHPLLVRRNLLALCSLILFAALMNVGLLLWQQSSLDRQLTRQMGRIAALEQKTSAGPLNPKGGSNYKAVIKEIKERVELLERSKLSPVRTLYEITRCLPSSAVTLTNLRIQPDAVSLEAEADSFSTADKMKKGLHSSPHFAEPAYGPTSHMKRGMKRVLRFSLTFGRRTSPQLKAS